MSADDLTDVWARSLADLAEMQIEPHQRAWLQLTRPLGLVENGDRITIDVDRQVLDLEVPVEELQARRQRRGPPTLPEARGYLSIYQRSVQPMSTGAVLVKKG